MDIQKTYDWKNREMMKMCPSPATLRFASVLTHSDNTAYTAHFVHPNFGFAETSYMLETLYEMAVEKRNTTNGSLIAKVMR